MNTKRESSPQAFGEKVLGPIVGEFCHRLWTVSSLIATRNDPALLFCARGGLRIQLAYEHFLRSASLTAPLSHAPLMVSRLVAVRPALTTVLSGHNTVLPVAVSDVLEHEFRGSSLSEVAFALSGVKPKNASAWSAPMNARQLVLLLQDADGAPVVEELTAQTELFGEHLAAAAGHREDVILVDTGLYGSTQQLLAEGFPTMQIGSALIARTSRSGTDLSGCALGLSVHAPEYSFLSRRTSLLRYWHLVESTFEPRLPSANKFTRQNGAIASNLQIEDWEQRVLPDADTLFQGVMHYLDTAVRKDPKRIQLDAEQAWKRFKRAVVWPMAADGEALAIASRSHDFGRDGDVSSRPWTGALGALRGNSIWREGEIARARTHLKYPMLASIESAYAIRSLKRQLFRF